MSGSAKLSLSGVNGATPKVAQPQTRELKATPNKELDPSKTEVWEKCWEKGLALAPHEDYVHSYKSYTDQRQYLVHKITLERIVLQAGADWSMAFDDGGFGGVFDTTKVVGGGDPFLLENLFRQVLCINNSTGALQVYDRSASKVVIRDVNTRLKQFIAFDVDVKVGSLNSIHEHACVQMAMCRGGFWCFWSSGKLYSKMGLKSFRGKASKWVYESSAAWREQLAAHGFHGKHVIASRRSSEASGEPVTPRGADPCSNVLPEPVMSSLCLLNCLFVWEWLSHNSMDSDHPKLKLQH